METHRRPFAVVIALGSVLLGLSLYWSLVLRPGLSAEPQDGSAHPSVKPEFFGGSKSRSVIIPDGYRAINVTVEPFDSSSIRRGMKLSLAHREQTDSLPRVVAGKVKLLSIGNGVAGSGHESSNLEITIMVPTADLNLIQQVKGAGSFVLRVTPE